MNLCKQNVSKKRDRQKEERDRNHKTSIYSLIRGMSDGKQKAGVKNTKQKLTKHETASRSKAKKGKHDEVWREDIYPARHAMQHDKLARVGHGVTGPCRLSSELISNRAAAIRAERRRPCRRGTCAPRRPSADSVASAAQRG